MKAIALVIALVVSPSLAIAQISLTAQAGVHFDRSRPGQRALGSMYAAPGEATTFGARIDYKLSRIWSLDLGAALSRNHSWGGLAIPPIQTLTSSTVFSSFTVRWSPIDALSLGAGPAFMFYGGTGRSLLTHQADAGVALVAVGRLRLTDELRLSLEVQDYNYRSTYVDAAVAFPGVTNPINYVGGTRWRSEFVLLPGITVTW